MGDAQIRRLPSLRERLEDVALKLTLALTEADDVAHGRITGREAIESVKAARRSCEECIEELGRMR